MKIAIISLAVLSIPAAARTIVVNPVVPGAADSNSGTEARPLATIGSAAALAEAGDTVRIYSGTYRETVAAKKSGTPDKPIRFEAAAGAVVVVTGADRIKTWRREPGDENVFSTEWPYPVRRPHPNDAAHLLVGRPEQVFERGFLLRLVPSRDKLTRGSFWVDAPGKRLWAQSIDDKDLSGRTAVVEASVRAVLWNGEGDYVHLRGIRFRYASNPAQAGAAIFSGRGIVIEDCVFERTNGVGAHFRGEDITVRRCDFSENGQHGFTATRAHRLRISDSVVRSNNVKDFSRSWSAGGNKLALTRGAVIERSVFRENRGTGIWFDIGNEDSTVRQCLIENNEDGGIFYEISYGLHAYDNVIVGNGLAETPGAWGAQAGITLSSSPECVIERNLLLGNREGIAFREQSRRTKRIGNESAGEEPVWNHHQTIRNNVLAFNTWSQLAGWFDVKDQRHWPRLDAAPGLALEDLHLTVAGNRYARHPGQPLVQWGPRWTRHRFYDSLEPVRSELHFEQDGVEEDLPFADPLVKDFRLPSGHAALRDSMPRGPVPGVALGSR